MDKQILNAIAEVLKDERQRFSIEIDDVAKSIPDYDQELERIEKAVDEFSAFVAAKREHDSHFAAEIEKIHASLGDKMDADSTFFSDLKKWADDFELRKEFDHLQFQEEFAEIKELALSVTDGENGANGQDGKDGQDGRDGVDNPAIAPICIDRDFKANKGLVVYHRGGLWQAIRNTNGDPETDSGNWNCFVDGVNDVATSFDPESALYSVHFEKTNGTKETVSFERPATYLPAGDHKSVEGDFFFDETSLNVYVQGTWLAKDLKGDKGEDGKDGTRGRVGKRGVGIDDIIPVDNGWKVLLSNGETKDLYLDLLGIGKEEVDQEIKRYAGDWHSSKSYTVGDVVTLNNSLFLALSNNSESPLSSANWVQMVSPASGGTFLSSDGDGSGGVGGIPDFVLVSEGGSGGTKLSAFKESTSQTIQFIGIDENKKDVKATLTTDMIDTNAQPFRNAKSGQFIGTPEELENLKNQRDVNEFFYKAINDIELGDIEIPPNTIVSDDPPDSPKEGQCWYDTGRLELFVYADEGWFPCSPLGARVEAGEVVQAQILGRVEAGEVLQGEMAKAIQQGIDDQEILEEKIEAGEEEQEKLKDKVAALEGSVGHHRMAFVENIGVRAGQFTLLSEQMQVINSISAAKYIYLSDTDAEGSPVQIGRIEPSDIIRLISNDDDSYGAELRVISDENDFFEFIQISGDADVLTVDAEYAFTLLSSFDPEGLATIDYVDDRVDSKLEVTGDKMSGALDMQGNHVSNVKSPATDGDAANKAYVDSHNEGNAKLDAKNTFTKANDFLDSVKTEKSVYSKQGFVSNGKASSTVLEVRGENESMSERYVKIRGTNRLDFICYPSQDNVGYKKAMALEWDAEANSPKVYIDYLKDPTTNGQAANKRYVDQSISNIHTGVDRTWKWDATPKQSSSAHRARWYELESGNIRFTISGENYRDTIQFANGVRFSADAKDMLTITGLKSNGKVGILAYALVSDFQMYDTFMILDCHPEYTPIFKPDMFEDGHIVTVKYGSLL